MPLCSAAELQSGGIPNSSLTHTKFESMISTWADLQILLQIYSMAIFVSAGAFLLAVKIPDDYAWHNTAVEAILICFACLEAFLLVINKVLVCDKKQSTPEDTRTWDILIWGTEY